MVILSQHIANLAILAVHVRIETFVWTLAQQFKLSPGFRGILACTFYSLPILWILNGMYIILFFSDAVQMPKMTKNPAIKGSRRRATYVNVNIQISSELSCWGIYSFAASSFEHRP
jgi:hypothetical protein